MIYIAGKITGLEPSEVSDKFQKAENELHYLGLTVINPNKLSISTSWPHEQQMELCYKVIDQKASAIYLLKDWKESKGAQLEFQYVAKLNSHRRPTILIYFEESDGLGDIRRDVNDKILTCLIPELS